MTAPLRITAIKVLQLRQHGGQALVKVETNAGLYGLGEAGASAAEVRAQVRRMSPMLIGQNPLEIEKLFGRMMSQAHPSRPHVPSISGIDMALWDVAGKALGLPVCELLTGKLRDEVPLYMNTGGPSDWFDPAACRAWADELKAQPVAWQTVKLGFEGLMGRQLPRNRYAVAQPSQLLTPAELRLIRQGYENCRQALGWETDLIVHCHNEWDLATAIGLAEAVAPARPLWLEDALPIAYADAWSALKQASPVRIMTGEKLETAREFLPFLAGRAVDVIHPDLAYAGGITGCRKIADLADLFYIPVVTHCVGSLVHMMATAHFGASTRNFVMSETRMAHPGHLVEQIGAAPVVIADGKLRLPTGPGLGIDLDVDVVKANLAEGETWWD